MTAQSGSHNQHARLAPSGSKQWTNCTASIAFVEKLRKKGQIADSEDSSAYAEEGTFAHDIASGLLLGGSYSETLESLDKTVEDVPDDMMPAVQTYVDFCREITRRHKTEPMIESEVPLFYDKNSTGTMDFGSLNKKGTEFHGVDYKHGAGVYVSASENTQLAIYGMSTIQELVDDGLLEWDPGMIVKLTIVQPRHRDAGVPSTWELTLQELQEFCCDIEDAVRVIRRDVATQFMPGEEICRWCAGKAVCKARIDALTEPDTDTVDVLGMLVDLDKDEKKLPAEERIEAASLDPMPDSQLLCLFRNRKTIERVLDDIAEHFLERAMRGDPVEGTKLVRGKKGNRVWSDEEAAEKLLAPKLKKDERFNMTLITPKQALDALGEVSTRFTNKMESLISQREGALTVTVEDDKREAVEPPCALLENLDEEDEEEDI